MSEKAPVKLELGDLIEVNGIYFRLVYVTNGLFKSPVVKFEPLSMEMTKKGNENGTDRAG